jgi:hypothetical protein
LFLKLESLKEAHYNGWSLSCASRRYFLGKKPQMPSGNKCLIFFEAKKMRQKLHKFAEEVKRD